MDKTIAHLGFIQAVISRMGANSFLLKGWSVTLVAAIFALSAKDADHRFVLLAYFPVLVFWALDAFFLHQEKLFRKLYEEVAVGRQTSDHFSMDTTAVKDDVASIVVVAFSKTLLPFHGLIVLVVLFAMFVIMAPCG
jgi:hypothetical protein